jgi:nucleoside-diphosphate-sugar epimerase
MAKVLVTGATGFTGQALCERLRSLGEQVVAFVRPTSVTGALEKIGVDCRVVELSSAEQLDRAFEPFDRVFHVAAAYRTELADRREFFRVNVEATRQLLERSRRYGVARFIHCSTVGVQGEIEDPPADEDYRLRPGDHYQDSKREGELLALAAFRDGLPGAVVRPVGIYGPGDQRFLKLFRAVARGRFLMIGSGETLYHLTFIDDLIDGFMLVSSHERALGKVFTIAGPGYTTLNELVATLAEVLECPVPRWRIPLAPVLWASVVCEKLCLPLGISPPLYPRRVEFFKLSRAFSTKRAQELLGYAPKVGLREGLGRTAEWYRQQGLL